METGNLIAACSSFKYSDSFNIDKFLTLSLLYIYAHYVLCHPQAQEINIHLEFIFFILDNKDS